MAAERDAAMGPQTRCGGGCAMRGGGRVVAHTRVDGDRAAQVT